LGGILVARCWTIPVDYPGPFADYCYLLAIWFLYIAWYRKDIGVLVDDQLTFSRHIQQQANSIMGLIRTYAYLYIARWAEFQIPFPGISKTTPWICRSSMVTIKGRGHRCNKKCPKKVLDHSCRLSRSLCRLLLSSGDLISLYSVCRG
jgi:hypothetical protein